MSRDPNCVFCKIVAVEIPAHVVYEDEAVLSFLDNGPVSEGHLLVIPRAHFNRLSQLPPGLSSELASVLPMLGRVLLRVTGAPAFNVLCNEGQVAGQVVPHVHIHLIPRWPGDSLGYRWNAGTYSKGRAAELTAAFQEALANHV